MSTVDNMPRLPRKGIVGARSEIEIFGVPVQQDLMMEILQAFNRLDPQSKMKVGSALIEIKEALELMHVEGPNKPKSIAVWIINISSGPVSCDARQVPRAY